MLITSSTQAEGKTTIASNLAISFAQMDKRVLILDSDMRRPYLHKIFPKPELNDNVLDDSNKTAPTASSDSRKPGLSELLIMANEKDPKAALSEIVRETEVGNLFVIPCGTIPPNPSERRVDGSRSKEDRNCMQSHRLKKIVNFPKSTSGVKRCIISAVQH
ncbi:MAG: tyrosine-protein kinase family protein [Candidatus Poribacteria bacterium]